MKTTHIANNTQNSHNHNNNNIWNTNNFVESYAICIRSNDVLHANIQVSVVLLRCFVSFIEQLFGHLFFCYRVMCIAVGEWVIYEFTVIRRINVGKRGDFCAAYIHTTSITTTCSIMQMRMQQLYVYVYDFMQWTNGCVFCNEAHRILVSSKVA